MVKQKWTSKSKFKPLEFHIECEKIIQKNADEMVKNLKQLSPRRASVPKNYASTWKFTKVGKKLFVVHNPDNYRLTHLLENGHFIVNKKGGVGWASPVPHIITAFNIQKPKFIDDMKNSTIVEGKEN